MGRELSRILRKIRLPKTVMVVLIIGYMAASRLLRVLESVAQTSMFARHDTSEMFNIKFSLLQMKDIDSPNMKR